MVLVTTIVLFLFFFVLFYCGVVYLYITSINRVFKTYIFFLFKISRHAYLPAIIKLPFLLFTFHDYILLEFQNLHFPHKYFIWKVD
jgi:hypothetical protein